MVLLGGIVVLAAVLALVLPPQWGVWGFLAVAAALFVLQAGINAALGFAGTSIEESLLLFGGSWAAYIGFNMQITYRAFALPLMALAAILIWRQGRA